MERIERIVVGDGQVMARWFATGGARGRVLLVPPFRMPATGLAPVGAALGFEGYDVVTFDPRYHVGDSTGGVEGFHLSSFADDCRRVIDRFAPTAVVAVSLGARAVLRALATHATAVNAVLLTPVVDLRSTLEVVLGQDWFVVPAGRVPPFVPVLGVDIGAPQFLRDADSARFVDPADTVDDLAAARGRVTLIPGTLDPWVDLATVRSVVGAAGGGGRMKVRPVACDRHLFHEDPELAISLIAAVIEEVNALHDSEPSYR